ncbi:hypothetical protein VNO78_34241 [Psophocarpus tetragonolobus]
MVDECCSRPIACVHLPVLYSMTHFVYVPETFIARPQVRRGYPLSLSISISGGKETNKDSLSNGERTGKSPP